MLSIARPTLLLLAALIGFARITDAATAGSVSSISSFTVPKSPSGMYYFAAQDLLYILCGTNTNGDHYLYAYTTGGAQRCSVTIPAAVGMSRVDGFQIVGDTAYIVDSQGPIYASTGLGGSLYAVAWTNPCGCDATGACTNAIVTWTPTIMKTYTLRASDSTISDGGGVDDVFRNSGVAVVGDSFYAVNGVHPAGPGGLSCCFPKSIVKMPLSGTGTGATRKWSFTASTIGRAVDMEGLTCGADSCADFLYVGDEYNFVYKVRLGTTDPAAAVETEFDLRSIVGSVPEDKGIEALTYSSKTGYFYAGIQETSVIHVVALSDSSSIATSTPTVSVVSGTASPTPTSAVTVPPTPTSTSTLPQSAPQSGSAASAPVWVWAGFAVAVVAVLETI